MFNSICPPTDKVQIIGVGYIHQIAEPTATGVPNRRSCPPGSSIPQQAV